ncbi:hypothetical protein MKW94_008054 [Papaver nudicaule]|uniref:DCD domain-containing protein n=1 Tax=Papaver nudicaule TaxID=74823 RepID=A0AA41SHJ2_PAPNU|nr:hypothetical protein [Papaver nudicaule]
MDIQLSFWQLGDELRGQTTKVSEDHQWFMAASKLAEQTRLKGERMNNLDLSKGAVETRTHHKFGFQDDNRINKFENFSKFESFNKFDNTSKFENLNKFDNVSKFDNFNFNMLNLDSKMSDSGNKGMFRNGVFNVNAAYQKGNGGVNNNVNMNMNLPVSSKFSNNIHSVKESSKNNNNNANINNDNNSNVVDKRFKTLPSTETLPRNEVLGGYIFVCNNDTMQEDLKRQLFGLPPRYRDSVRAITPGLPLFLYNYTTHQLHGIFEAVSFGGSNIDPTAWEDKKCKGESRFPAQVRIRIRKICKALEEDSFRPVLHHYDGPKFRLELSIPETLALLDLCEQGGSM